MNALSNTQMGQLLMPLILIQIALIAYSLYKLYKEEVNYLPKWAWLLIILFVSTIGPIIFLIIGEKKE